MGVRQSHWAAIKRRTKSLQMGSRKSGWQGVCAISSYAYDDHHQIGSALGLWLRSMRNEECVMCNACNQTGLPGYLHKLKLQNTSIRATTTKETATDHINQIEKMGKGLKPARSTWSLGKWTPTQLQVQWKNGKLIWKEIYTYKARNLHFIKTGLSIKAWKPNKSD